MIIVNKFMKLWYFIALEFFDVETIIDTFIKNVFKLHELSDIIISDHNNQFVSTVEDFAISSIYVSRPREW